MPDTDAERVRSEAAARWRAVARKALKERRYFRLSLNFHRDGHIAEFNRREAAERERDEQRQRAEWAEGRDAYQRCLDVIERYHVRQRGECWEAVAYDMMQIANQGHPPVKEEDRDHA